MEAEYPYFIIELKCAFGLVYLLLSKFTITEKVAGFFFNVSDVFGILVKLHTLRCYSKPHFHVVRFIDFQYQS